MSGRARSGRTGLAVFGVLLATGCGEAPLPPAATAPPVLVARAESHDLVERIEASGEVRAQAEARVAAQVEGEVTGVALDEGDAAGEGALVIEIDPERRRLQVQDAAAAVVEAEAQLGEAQREARRIERLHAQQAASDAQLDSARTGLRQAGSRLEAARARLGLAERALRDAFVRAPFAGLIGERHVNVGEYVRVGEPLFELVALDPVEVEFRLTELDSARVAVGQAVGVRVAPFPDERFEATVSVIAPTLDPATRTLRVKALLPNPDGRLRPGLFARVDLGVAERRGVVMVPEEAVLQRADGSVIYRFREAELPAADGRVERVRVELGVHGDRRVELVSGVAEGDLVVVRGQTRLVDGGPVSLRTADGAPLDRPPRSGTMAER